MNQLNHISDSRIIDDLVNKYTNILIIQADNPDADSLASSLALEEIFTKLNKSVYQYCAVVMPEYLHYIDGWDRVSTDFPSNFELVIFVDVSTYTLLEKMISYQYIQRVKVKPTIVLDHHKEVKNKIDFAKVIINQDQLSSTGELIYRIATDLNWPINIQSGTAIMASILGDTQGLSNQLTKPETYRLIADLIDLGVDRLQLDEKRKQYSLMPIEIFRYKSELINRTEFFYDNSIALICLNQNDISKYSSKYNQGPLIQSDILQVKNVKVSIIIKAYKDRHLTASIRCNYNYAIAANLAVEFGGGGHAYASGINLKNINVNEFKKNIIEKAYQLLNKL